MRAVAGIAPMSRPSRVVKTCSILPVRVGGHDIAGWRDRELAHRRFRAGTDEAGETGYSRQDAGISGHEYMRGVIESLPNQASSNDASRLMVAGRGYRANHIFTDGMCGKTGVLSIWMIPEPMREVVRRRGHAKIPSDQE